MSVPPAAFAQRSLNAPVGSEIYDRIWNDFLTKFKSHLDEKGWFDKTVLYMDETREPTMKPVIKLIQANNPNWKIGLAGSHVSAATENALFDYSSILGSERETASTPGRISTFYTSCSQLFPNAYVTARTSPAEMPWMAWYAANTHRDGYLRWAYDYWTQPDPADIRDGANSAGDYSMVYRTDSTARSTVVSSIRLELLREGIQDFEKIRILKGNKILEAEVAKFSIESGKDAAVLVEEAEQVLKTAAKSDKPCDFSLAQQYVPRSA